MTPLHRYIAHAMLGSMLGAITAGIFWMVYLFQRFDLPVSNSLRLRSAFVITGIILIAVLLVWSRNAIYAYLKKLYDVHEEEREDE